MAPFPLLFNVALQHVMLMLQEVITKYCCVVSLALFTTTTTILIIIILYLYSAISIAVQWHFSKQLP